MPSRLPPWTLSLILTLARVCDRPNVGVALLWQMANHEDARLRCAFEQPNLMTDLPVPPLAVVGSGLMVGFCVSDVVVLLLSPAFMADELGGRVAYTTMWLHHLLPITIFPYAILTSRSAIFVTYFMATELTNVGQNLYVLASRGRLFGAASDRVARTVGICWLLSFFLLRIAPLPILGSAYLRGHYLEPTTAPKMGLIDETNAYGCGLAPGEWWVSAVSIPIPVALNIYWFGLMVRKAVRELTGTSKSVRGRKE